MHLIYENLLKNLILLWTDEFKGLDEGSGCYTLSKAVWEAVGQATAASGSTIPSAFGARPPNIASDRSNFTAENYSFWALYIGPILLRNKFRDRKYYDHFVDLIVLLNICLQFELTVYDVETIRTGFVHWVQKFEDLYYQHDPARISACPLTIHAILHIAESILAAGPVWAYWAFPMERYCATLLPAIKSRRFPFASIDKFVTDTAQLTHIKHIYNARDELTLTRIPGPMQGEFRSPGYPTCALLPPRKLEALSTAIMSKIAIALATRFNVSVNVARRHLPDEIFQYGKVRRIDGGDTMSASEITKSSVDRRDASYVRYEMLVDKNTNKRSREPEFRLETYYGQLKRIFVVKLEATPDLPDTPTILFMAAITNCIIDSRNKLDMHFYSRQGRTEVVDITCIQCLVGRIRYDNQWAIIDRSGSLARALHSDDDNDEA
ncbi:hypothetical protein BD410DRAFT_846724 [Rickenella mellea]|uniref:DUF4218 domain-containing protein n=1 Tax=Rickenella mellea TaxID=50990 RepID=A0A4Y7PED9_9AGAM|nr:hypothetical protein BD410DRAFT_846724 [Rickenella mellea]